MTIDALDGSTAVICVDLQTFTTSLPAANDMGVVVANAVSLVRAFRAQGFPVVLAKNNLNDSPVGRTSYPRRDEAVPDQALALIEEVGPEPDDIVVVRGAWSAFHGTDLDRVLRRRQVTDLVIVGLATNFGVESTARAAYDLGYHVVVVADAVTGPMEGAHQNTLNSVVPALGLVVTTEEVLARLPT